MPPRSQRDRSGSPHYSVEEAANIRRAGSPSDSSVQDTDPSQMSFPPGGGTYGYSKFELLRGRTKSDPKGRSKEASESTGGAASGPPSERDISLWRLNALFLGWSFCCVAWVLGLLFPSATLDFLPGTDMEWHMTKSLLQTLQHLLEERIYFSFAALAFFSIVVPVGKMALTFMLIYRMLREPVKRIGDANKLLIAVLTYFASYQFVDLYVGIMFVAFFNADASDANFQVGFYWFFSYLLISMGTSVMLENTFQSFEEQEPADPNAVMPMRPGESGPETPPPSDGSLRSGLASALHALSGMASRAASAVNGGAQDSASSRAEKGMGSAVAAAPSADGSSRPRAKTEGGLGRGPEVPLYRRPLRSADAQDTTGESTEYRPAAKREAYTDPKTTWAFSGIFLFCMIGCPWFDMLEVRMLMHEIAIDRKAMSLKGAMFQELPIMTHPIVMVFLWLVTVVCPLAYTFAVLVRLECRRRHENGQLSDWQALALKAADPVPEWLRQWAMTDVVTIASLIFVFMFQDEHTLTMPPDGSLSFYLFLGAGFSFFYLRWFVDCANPPSVMVLACRTALLGAFWLATCVVIIRGIPGAAHHFKYNTMGAICKHTQPFMNQAILEMPASYGNCTDKASNPPEPCIGHANLHTEDTEDGYMNAIWMGGLRTTSFNSCSLAKTSDADNDASTTQYRLAMSGVFGHLSMFLRVKSCSAFGCTHLNSADNCCGSHLGFNFSFRLMCKPPGLGYDAIRKITFEDIKIDPMIVDVKMMGGALKINAMDISPKVEKAVKEQVQDMMAATIPWGGKPLSLAQILNKIVWYNAPARAGTCF